METNVTKLASCEFVYVFVCLFVCLFFSCPHFRLNDAGKMVLVVLMHGAPVVSSVYSEVAAVISAGYTGQGGGLLRTCHASMF